MTHFALLAATVAAAFAACMLPVSAFSLPHYRPQIRSWTYARSCSELPPRRTAGILLVHDSSESRLHASSKMDDDDSGSGSNSISDDNKTASQSHISQGH